MGNWKHRVLEFIPPESVVCAACGPVVALKKQGRWKCSNAIREQRGKNYPHKCDAGVTIAERACLLTDRCEVCGGVERLVLDHNHATKDIRGTLCSLCNSGLGMFKDSAALMQCAIRYLKKKPLISRRK